MRSVPPFAYNSGTMKSRWSEKDAARLAGVDLVVYASRVIGMDSDLVVWGGGNSSIKVDGTDHAGRPTRILWIKGSGSDMRTITARQFTPLWLDDLLPLIDRAAMTDEAMVAYQSRSVLEPGAPKPSIETLLHAFLPPPHIYHTHADAICALTDTPDGRATVRAVYGDDVGVVDYIRPGFLLSKWTGEAYAKNPGLRAIILDKHGLITWGKTAKEAYRETIRIVTEAERYIAEKMRGRTVLGRAKVRPLPAASRREAAARIAPVLRGRISVEPKASNMVEPKASNMVEPKASNMVEPKASNRKDRRMLLQYEDAPDALELVNSTEGRRLSQIGPFTPDHLLHTKPWPLFVDTDDPRDPDALARAVEKGLDQYRSRYIEYFNKYKTPGVTMLDPNPRVILIPGLGMFTTGKDRRATRIVRDLYRHTIGVIRASTALGGYHVLSERALCDFEYWPMENFKLTLLPPEKELSRRIALVTGAAGGIGRAIARRLAEAGASVILTDVDAKGIATIADEINRKAGEENAAAIPLDVTDERQVARAFQDAVRIYGGLDILVSNAGIARTAPIAQLSLSDWEASLAVNATGHFLVCREAVRVMQSQGLGGAIVAITTKNVLAPGKEFGAYSASKAAQAQLARVLAIEGADHGIRVNLVNPDGVFQDSGLWSKEVREERARAHGIDVKEVEAFYAGRNLLKARILPEDVAEAVLFFASDRSAKTTGAILPVDGGLRDAFPR